MAELEHRQAALMKSISLALVCLVLLVAIDNAESRPKRKLEEQIMGGEEVTTATKYSFLAFILVRRWNVTDWDYSQCGGTLVDRNHVLTATHCIMVSPGSKHRTLVSTNDIQVRVGCRVWTDCAGAFGVQTIYAYRPYGTSKNEHENDIALIELFFDVENEDDPDVDRRITRVRYAMEIAVCPNWNPRPRYNSTSKPRPRRKRSPPEELWPKELHAVGWGRLKYDDPEGVFELREVKVSKVPFDECKKTYPGIIREKVICYGNLTHTVLAGDSGGPLFANFGFGYMEQVGVTSLLEKHKPQKHGAVFTRVSHYSPWILACRMKHPYCYEHAYVLTTTGFQVFFPTERPLFWHNVTVAPYEPSHDELTFGLKITRQVKANQKLLEPKKKTKKENKG